MRYLNISPSSVLGFSRRSWRVSVMHICYEMSFCRIRCDHVVHSSAMHRLCSRLDDVSRMFLRCTYLDCFGSVCKCWCSHVSCSRRFNLFYGVVPFAAPTLLGMYDAIRDNELVFPDTKNISDQLKDLISKLLRKNPDERIGLPEVFSHPYVLPTEFPWHEILLVFLLRC